MTASPRPRAPRVLALIAATTAALAVATGRPDAAAAAGKHFALVLDTSSSMTDGFRGRSNPDCSGNYAVLSALILRELLDPGDRLDVVDMGERTFRSVSVGDVRGFEFLDGTTFHGPVQKACALLAQSSATHKVLVVLTDGQVGESPAMVRGTCPGLSHGVHAFGLGVGGADMNFLQGLLGPANARRVADPAALVQAFAGIFGAPMGARALTGSVAAGTDHEIPIRPYVASAYLALTTAGAGADFSARLTAPDGTAARAARSHGDNRFGRFYEVIKLDHPDPGRWLLRASGAPLHYVLIQRYDLELQAVDAAPECVVGQPTRFRFHLVSGKGAHFHDPQFYREDHFRSALIPPAGRVATPPDAAGNYEVAVTPTAEGPLEVGAEIQTDVMALAARAACTAKRPPFEARAIVEEPGEKLYPGEPQDVVIDLTRPDGTPYDDRGILDSPDFATEVEIDGGIVGRPTRGPDGRWRFSFRPETPGAHKFVVRFRYRGETLEASRTMDVRGIAGRHATVVAPTICWRGEACPVEASLYEVMGGPLLGDARILGAPTFRATLVDGAGAGLPLTPKAGSPGAFGASWTPGTPGETTLTARFEAFGQSVEATRRVLVQEPLRLPALAELDLGTIEAGAEWATTCRPLDFTGAVGYDGIFFAVSAPAPPPAAGELCTADAGTRIVLGDGVEFALAPDALTVPVCVETARCGAGGEVRTTVTITPRHPRFASQVLTVPLRYVVEEQSFLACNLWWLAIVGGSLLLVFVVYGFLRPHNFRPEDALRLAGQERALARAAARQLRALPGGRSGFYRNACVWIGTGGGALRGRRGAILGLEAGRAGEIRILAAHGGLRARSPASRKFEAVDGKPVVAARNRDYELGELYFRVS